MAVRLVTTLAILMPLLAARLVAGRPTPWWHLFALAFVAFGIGRVVQHLVDRGRSPIERRLGWGLMIGGAAASSLFALWGTDADVVEKLGRVLAHDAGPPPPAPPWQHHPGVFARVAVGDTGACAVKESDRSVVCWGDPAAGFRPTPAPVAFLQGLHVDVAVGSRWACAVTGDGEVSCWQPRAASAETIAVARVASIAGGDALFCGVDRAGDVWCWTGESRAPGRIAGLAGARDVAVAGSSACALSKSGEVHCWDGPGRAPSRVDGLPRASAVAVSPLRACAVADGRLHCWGLRDRKVAEIEGMSNVTSIAVSDDVVCAATGSGRVRCKGKNTRGRLGTHDLGDVAFHAIPGTELHTVGGVSTGAYATCAIDRDGEGEIACWGSQ